jgi:hypothetical protein
MSYFDKLLAMIASDRKNFKACAGPLKVVNLPRPAGKYGRPGVERIVMVQLQSPKLAELHQEIISHLLKLKDEAEKAADLEKYVTWLTITDAHPVFSTRLYRSRTQSPKSSNQIMEDIEHKYPDGLGEFNIIGLRITERGFLDDEMKAHNPGTRRTFYFSDYFDEK